jgi:hypothetical protein
MSMAAHAEDKFAGLMEAVAKRLLGDPNKALSGKGELRFGTHGSLSVDLTAGVWSDHEAKTGGGVLDLVKREIGLEGQAAIEWLNAEVNAGFEDRPAPGAKADNVHPMKRIVAEYDYRDETGALVFQTVRFEPKGFSQRRPDPDAKGGWAWSVRGVRQVPYRLAEVLRAARAGETIYVVEGEKDADALAREGLCATCNAMGAGKWPKELSEHFAGADVVILPDNDHAGATHAGIVAGALKGVAKSVRVLELPDLGPKQDVSDWLNAGGDGFQLVELTVACPLWRPEPPQSRFGAVLWSGIDSAQGRRDWLVEDLIFCGDSGLNYGASQSGKSFLQVDMGLAIARGVPFLGKRTLKGCVVYQAGEGGLGLLSRLKAYRKHYDIAADDPMPFALLPRKVDLYGRDSPDPDDFVAEVQAWAAYWSDPVRLVVIDTFSTASPGANENASEDVSRVLACIERIQREVGCAVIAVHHKNAGGEKPRGHTSLYANADTALEVTRDEVTNLRTLRVAKVKDGQDGEKIPFQLQSVEIGAYESGKPITSCVVVPAEDGDRRTGPNRKPLTTDQRMFLTALDAAIRMHGGVLPPVVRGTEGPYTRGVEWPHFMTVFRQIANPDKSDEALRKQLQRDGDYLVTRGFVGRDKPWVWLTEKGGLHS